MICRSIPDCCVPNFVIPNHIGLLAPNIPCVLLTYHPKSKEEEDPGYSRKVSVAAAANINVEAAITNSSPLLKK
jgi:hypothetical protein